MRLSKGVLPAMVVAALGCAAISHAFADDMFLRIDGIPGESTDAAYKDAIALVSFNTGVMNTASIHSGGSGGGKPLFEDFTFTTYMSRASPQLFLRAAEGRHINEAVLNVRSRIPNQPGFEYLTIKLREVFVVAAGTGLGSSGRVLEQYALQYARIEFSYRPLNSNGSPGAEVRACYDIKMGTKC